MDERHARAAEMRAQGVPYRKIAVELGVAPKTIFSWMNPVYAERRRETSRAYKKRNRAQIRERDRFYELHRRGRAEMPYDRFLRELDGASVA